eukprot:COSAG01_NODE_30765_length_609_cov_1198.066667_2_plen_135_part_01
MVRQTKYVRQFISGIAAAAPEGTGEGREVGTGMGGGSSPDRVHAEPQLTPGSSPQTRALDITGTGNSSPGPFDLTLDDAGAEPVSLPPAAARRMASRSSSSRSSDRFSLIEAPAGSARELLQAHGLSDRVVDFLE